MLVHVRHETVYAYERPLTYAVQLLRLTPRPHAGLAIRTWHVGSDRRAEPPAGRDGFGNVTHLHAVTEPHASVRILAEGVVETQDTSGLVRDATEPMPPAFYRRTTALTAPTPALAALADEAAALANPLDRLHRLLELVHERLVYRPGATDVATAATDALVGGGGVCQDFAHVFVAATRLLGMPARYVSGYLCTRDAAATIAGHAWAEAYEPVLGWIGFDAVAGTCPGAGHVACAVGLDYLDAAPVRGVRRAREGEALTVRVTVAEMPQQ